MRLPVLPVLFLAMPILEIAGFIMVGKALGLWATLGLVLASSLAGAVLLRSGGSGILQKMAAVQRDPRRHAEVIGTGFTRMAAGFLLLVPGFITSVFGLLLLIPGAGSAILRLVGIRTFSTTSASAETYYRGGYDAGRSAKPSSPDIVDLDADEYSHTDDRPPQDGRSPWSGNNLPEK